MPLRRASIPKGALLQLYRPFTYGTLASISMLDTRQYRTDQPCGDNVQLPCAGTQDPRATMLGRRAGEVADRPPRSIAGGMELSGSAGSHGTTGSLCRTGAPFLNGQMGWLRAEPLATSEVPGGAKAVQSRHPGGRRPQQLGERHSTRTSTTRSLRSWQRSSSAPPSPRPVTDPICRR